MSMGSDEPANEPQIIFSGTSDDLTNYPGAYLDGYLNGLIDARKLSPAELEAKIVMTKAEIVRDDEAREQMSRG